MNEFDFTFWISVLISSIYGAHDKNWQQLVWCVFALLIMVVQIATGN